MWVFATFYNLLLSVLPLEWPGGIYNDKDVVLATMGRVAAGMWLMSWVSIDAFIVLAGEVLTSYVRIMGLVRRVAFDRASLVVLLHADASVLAGVFTFAFLGVMALFAFGCMLLKLKREDIPRDVHAPWWSCIFGLVMVLLGLLGNLLGDPAIFTYFALYFVVFASTMFIMLERVFILHILLYIMQQLFPSRGALDGAVEDVEAAKSQGKVKDGSRLEPREAALSQQCFEKSVSADRVLHQNTQSTSAQQGHPVQDSSAEVTETDVQRRQLERENVEDMREITRVFDLTYPKVKIDFVHVGGSSFDNALVHWISEELRVQSNTMFIRQPGTKHIHQVAALGVRVITG
ncbi:hypothetical protein PRNP1_013146 [Phytophthora ramorum]